MNRGTTDKNLLNLSYNELLEKKKKIIAHCTNLECKKQQLSVLIEKLTNISSERKNLLSAEQNQGLFFKLFSMGDQLKQALSNKTNLETEISQAKEQMDKIISTLNEKRISDKG